MPHFRILTEVTMLKEYIVEAEDGGEAASKVPSSDANQTQHEPEVIMSITASDEDGNDLYIVDIAEYYP